MTLEESIREELRKTFLGDFNVKSIDKENLVVTLPDSYEEYFQMDILVRNQTRLKIKLTPEKYAANFVRALGESSVTQRKNFNILWDKIGSSKLTLFLNGEKVNKENFLSFTGNISKFELSLNIAPYYDPEKQDSNKVVADYVSIICGMVLSLVNYKIEGYQEGKRKDIHASRYERNPMNRSICLYAKGYKCAVCGFDFEETYGEIGKDFIEVHHIKPVSSMGENYVVDPINDLVPVCSNCHSMLHRRNPPYSVKELKDMMAKTAVKDFPQEYKISIHIGKLKSVEEDNNIKVLINNMMGADEGTTLLSIMKECYLKFGESYPNMFNKDWYHLIKNYVIKITGRDNLRPDETFKFDAA